MTRQLLSRQEQRHSAFCYQLLSDSSVMMTSMSCMALLAASFLLVYLSPSQSAPAGLVSCDDQQGEPRQVTQPEDGAALAELLRTKRDTKDKAKTVAKKAKKVAKQLKKNKKAVKTIGKAGKGLGTGKIAGIVVGILVIVIIIGVAYYFYKKKNGE